MITFTAADNKLLCSFNSHLGGSECKTVDARLAEAIAADPATEIVFDMSGVEYISSAFLKICLLTAKTKGNGQFQITNASPSIQKLFEMANLKDALNVQ